MTPAEQEANEKIIFDFFAPMTKLWPIGSCGMTAQAQGESSFNPKAIGDHDTAFGLWELHPQRAAAILKATGLDVTKLPSVIDQCNAVWWELTHTEAHALAMIRAAKTPYDAGVAACVWYERPSAPGAAVKRGDYAVKIAQKYGVVT